VLDHLLINADEFWSHAVAEISRRGLWHWVLATMPLLLFGDVLYYYVPPILVAVLHPFARRRETVAEARHRHYLGRYPMVSVIIAGRNEEECIANCVRSLLEQEYPNLEIIVVDDNSTDRMYEIADQFARRGQIRLLRNNASSGRGGRPHATNLGVRVSRGEFIISVDADTTFDRDLILHMIGPFCDPRVGVVAGNLKVRNLWTSFVTRMQAIEYLVGIGLGKRWTDLRGVTLQASGALGAFRREAVLAVGQWDSELAEDTDISLKLQKAGWHVRFAPKAIAMTDAPRTWRAIARQRYRWDRGTLRTFYHKHSGLMDPRRYRLGLVFELAVQYFFSTPATLFYPVYILLMLAYLPWVLLFVMLVALTVCSIASAATTLAAVAISERRRDEWRLVPWSILLPFYKEYLRWIRLKATIHEILRIHYEDPFLPDSAWRCAPRW
jgi:cellulose synthase/poly-beta-1,6-N-acetylglucosamine synthase-like glycosyltransferase